MTQHSAALPHWDMTVVYPGLDSPEFEAGFADAITQIADLNTLFDDHAIGLRAPAPLDDQTVATFETVASGYNAVLDAVRTLGAYITAFVATDSRDDLAQARLSQLQQHTMRLSQLGTRFTAWIGSLDIDALIDRSELAREHRFVLQQARTQSEHLMSPAEEALATELNLSSGTAWAKLHSILTSQLAVPIEIDGETRSMPMSMARNLAYEADRDVRRRAFEAELEGWRGVTVPLAAALNSIKGEVNTLAQRRGWDSPLHTSLFDNGIDQPTLDAMIGAARESFPDFRRYLRAKARALGVEQLAWYDLFAPVGTADRVWPYNEATEFIARQFGTYSQRLSSFATRAFAENWIDAEPRPGKRDGAFCMGLRRDESRVFSNYKPAFGGVRTLAHELGHAYHNLNLANRTALQRVYPMTLAETASIFCETIVGNAALREADPQEQIAILEATLQNNCQIVVDITSRFLFEQNVFTTRRDRELSVDELNAYMLQAQRDTYGDGLDQSTLHPYMWAVKGHYYSTGRSFYNYPYMFGLLFGLGLYARYQQDPDGFKAGYDDLLSSTGLHDAATLGSRFGIDIRSVEFWRSSLDIVRADIDRFEQLIAPGTAWTAGDRNGAAS